jgi:hypothetical protein
MMTSLQSEEASSKEADEKDGSTNDVESKSLPDGIKNVPAASSSSNPNAEAPSPMTPPAGRGADSRPQCPSAVLGGGSRIPLESLPPLPAPKYGTIRRETVGGASVVMLLIVVLVGLTNGVALTAVGTVPPDSPARVAFLALIYGEGLSAAICLLGILFVDPGFVPRSPETCYPLPPQVEAWVRSLMDQKNADDATAAGGDSKENVDGGGQAVVENRDYVPIEEGPATIGGIIPPPTELYIADTDANGGTGRVYCTRCLVWRPPGINHYHCATCQRCCGYYDHHCPFFGRCIAGDKRMRSLCHIRRGGNFKFFVTILVVGVGGYLTTAASLMYALSLRYGAKWVVPIGLAIMLWTHTSFTNPSPNGVCGTFRCVVFELLECLRKCLRKLSS